MEILAISLEMLKHANPWGKQFSNCFLFIHCNINKYTIHKMLKRNINNKDYVQWVLFKNIAGNIDNLKTLEQII